jgi:hypothetical protein
MSTMARNNILALVVAVGALMIGSYLSTTPKGVHLPIVPWDSPTRFIPPWPLFNIAISINELLVRLVKITTHPTFRAVQLATAYWQSEVVYALVKNGIVDAIDRATSVDKNGITCETVAQDLGLSVWVTCEYIQAGYYLDIFEATHVRADTKYKLSAVGKVLSQNHKESIQDFALMINEETFQAWRAAGTQSILHGKHSGFVDAFQQSIWQYHNAHPVQEAQFDRAMKSLSGVQVGAILSDWDPPTPNITLCDIGGGIGTMLVYFLQHYPEMKGMVFDQESVTPRGIQFLKEKQLIERVQHVGGNFFHSPWPSQLHECNVFFLKFILHDWADEESLTILKNIKDTAKKGSTIVIAEHVMGATQYFRGLEATKALMSINMVASCGAKERSLTEFNELFLRAGLTNTPKITLTRNILSLIEIEV